MAAASSAAAGSAVLDAGMEDVAPELAQEESRRECAFNRSDLQIPDGTRCIVLGDTDVDDYAAKMCARAGIGIVQLDASNTPLNSLYQMCWIKTEGAQKHFLQNRIDDKICVGPQADVFGLQIILAQSVQWKITISEEIPDAGTRRAPKRVSSRAVTSNNEACFISRNMYEILHECSPGANLNTTLAVAEGITINLLFAWKVIGKPDTLLMDENKIPIIAQRRVDVCFSNKHLSVLQVCSVLFCCAPPCTP